MRKLNKAQSQFIFQFSRKRTSNGYQIAELPPALILIFFAFLFPVLNMLYFIGAFAVGWYLNTIELRQVACCLPSSIGLTNPPDQQFHVVVLPQSQNWNNLFGVSEDVNSPQVAQFPPTTPGSNPNMVDKSIVKTTINVKPFITMHSLGTLLPLGKIPGLGKPITFVYTSSIQQEEPGV